MTFKRSFSKLTIVLAVALFLAALLMPVMGITVSQAIAAHDAFDLGTAETVQADLQAPVVLACACGDPGGQGGCC